MKSKMDSRVSYHQGQTYTMLRTLDRKSRDDIMRTTLSVALALSAHAAAAQDMRETVRSDPFRAFDIMLELQRERDAEGLRWTVDAPRRRSPPSQDMISTCYWSQDVEVSLWDDDRDVVAELQFLSSYYYFVARDLAAVGYPDALWRDSLDTYVWGLVELAASGSSIFGDGDALVDGSAFERELALRLDIWDTTEDRDRIFADFEPWAPYCGGDPGYFVYVATEPPGASVFRLRRFTIRLCDSLGAEPFTRDCEGMLTPPDQWIPVGTYGYLVQWQDGDVSCGYTTFDSDEAGDPQTITLNPPKGVCNGWD